MGKLLPILLILLGLLVGGVVVLAGLAWLAWRMLRRPVHR